MTTGCSMMLCKKALKYAKGDTDEAIKFLREHGQAYGNSMSRPLIRYTK